MRGDDVELRLHRGGATRRRARPHADSTAAIVRHAVAAPVTITTTLNLRLTGERVP
jgi:hypothetical protein